MEKSPEQLYKEREKRVNDAIQLKVPDQVPVVTEILTFSIKYTGITGHDAMYDYDKVMSSLLDTLKDFQPDMVDSDFGFFFLGPLLDALDYQALAWPGHGLASDSHCTYQFLEKEFITADEYDAFIYDPTDFMIRTLWPRVFGALKPLAKLPPLHEIISYYLGSFNFGSFSDPDIKGAFEAMDKAGEHIGKIFQGYMEQGEKLKSLGFPPFSGGITQAPFDTISDFFRGTRGSLLDMLRCPDKLLEAIEKMYPIMLKTGLYAKEFGVPRVWIPLHKCLDTFMSNDQFKTFFWPTLKRLIEDLSAAGIVSTIVWEGDCTSRLEIIGDIPRGKAIYFFEQTDIFKAKEILGDVVCIRGGVPLPLLVGGTPDDVKEYCKKLIDVVGKGGGFMMDCADPADVKPENLRAMFDFTREYGVYK